MSIFCRRHTPGDLILAVEGKEDLGHARPRIDQVTVRVRKRGGEVAGVRQ